jgi:putative transposase
MPRDRQASFEPKIVAKGQTRWTGFDDKIISMYAGNDDARHPRAPGGDVQR